MKLFLVTLAVLAVLGILMFSQRGPSRPAPAAPVVVYRTVERQAAVDAAAAANLKYLSDVAERQEFRRRYEITYGEKCPL